MSRVYRGSQLRREARRKEILRISGRIFREKTFNGTTLDDISKAVGILKGSLYYYISSKKDLFSEIIIEAARVVNDALLESQRRDLPPVERLRETVKAHVKYAVEYQDSAILFFTGRHVISSMGMTELQRLFGIRDEYLRKALKEAVDQRIYQIKNIKMTAIAIVGMCNSVVFWYNPSGPMSHEEIAAVLFNLIHKGLLVRS